MTNPTTRSPKTTRPPAARKATPSGHNPSPPSPRAERGAYDCDNCNDRGSVVDGSGERVRCWACR